MSTEVDKHQETVFWVNRFSERSIRKILESLRILEVSKEQAMTVIPAGEIDTLEDEELRESLKRQLQNVRENAGSIELPVVHMPQKRFSHSYGVLSKSDSTE